MFNYKSLNPKEIFFISENSNIFFTSDLHLFHKNILRMDNMPWPNVQEMYDYVINLWNSKIKNTDHVFILGDVIWGSQKNRIDNFCSKANGYKHLLTGNHDDIKKDNFTSFLTVDTLAGIQIQEQTGFKQNIVMSHYPLRSWRGEKSNSWDLFGHCHDHCAIETLKNNQCDIGFSTKWLFKDNKFDIYSYEDVKKKLEYINKFNQLKNNLYEN